MYSIIVVEDEAIVRNGIVSLVSFDKLAISKVYQAANGQEAWSLIQTYTPDIVLTDINMPHMDGITLAKQVKAHYPDTKIIFLTGYDHFEYARAAIKLGADDYILKPVSRKDIEAMLVTVIDKLELQRKQQTLQQVIQADTQDNALKQRIHQHLSDSTFSLKKLADLMGFSQAHTSMLVKKTLGIPFQDYVIQQRMEQAKVLLLASDQRIYEIAEQVGFDDVNYFSARFKHYTQLTPKQYRKGEVL